MFEFLDPVALQTITGDEAFKEGQYGKAITVFESSEPNWQDADIILMAVPEERGKGKIQHHHYADTIRKQFYRLYCWHPAIKICDIGNIKPGNNLQDTYAAVEAVTAECLQQNKTLIILGNSHDITLAQYGAYAKNKMVVEATCIDATMDMSLESPFKEENFLVEMLTGEPNYIRHYNHLGFQSYFVHPKMMDTLEKLRFDCYRVGRVKEHIHDYEPIIRSSNFVSLDINALQNAVMPCNHTTPNGFTGEEACMLTRYAGFSNTLSTLGIYNYNSATDTHAIGAIQIAQMIWYFIDGRHQLSEEKDIGQKEFYNEYNTAFADISTVFYQNKTTRRWWMQLPNKQYLPCSHKDYIAATKNEIPERWLRAQERNL